MLDIYKYKSVTNSGRVVEGEYSGRTENDIVKIIRKKNQIPIKIEKIENKSRLKEFFNIFNYKIKFKDLSVFCKQLHTMLYAGMPLKNSLEVLLRQTKNKRLSLIVEAIVIQIQKGISLSSAMQNYEVVFTPLLINMVKVGEITGNLDEVLDKMAKHFENEYKINQKIRNTLIYPIILGIISTIVVILILVFIMPSFINMFHDFNARLPLPTKLLLLLSKAIIKYNFLILILILLFFLCFKKIYHVKFIKEKCDELKFKLPIIKTIVVELFVMRFTRVLSLLLSSGLPIVTSLDVSADTTNNKFVETKIKHLTKGVKKGSKLAALWDDMQFLPPMVVSMIAIGEESGALDKMLLKISDFYEEEFNSHIEKLISIFEPAMIIIMSLIVGSIIFAIMLPMFEMMELLV